MKKLAIIGSGPAGITAAISASRYADKSLEIHIFEQKDALCKSILATGNGRCNFSNVVIEVDRYYNAQFVCAFNTHKQSGESVCEILSALGLEITINDAGLMFPASMKASSVRDVLLNAFNKINAVAHICEDGFDAAGFDAVVIASGHNGPYCFKRKLCPIKTVEDVSVADNVRAKVKLTLFREGNVIFEECGEVQFRKYGISGIVVFNASRYAERGDVIKLDFTYPCNCEMSARDHFCQRFEANDGDLESFFKGFLHDDLAKLITSRLKRKISFEKLWSSISAFEMEVDSVYEDEKLSQVSRGGIDVEVVDSKTLRVNDKNRDNVYACGEVLDVDGPCGGYNLTWVFESGWRAGKCAALDLRS